jgi:hypothetical protein
LVIYFDRELGGQLCASGDASGTTLMVLSDFGGSHAGQLFETYSFLVMCLEDNLDWLARQRAFREFVLRSNRRIAYKSLSDKVRRAVMPAFLGMGSEIRGSLITFAISRDRPSVFQAEQGLECERLLVPWRKKHIRERLLRVLHLGAFLLSGLSLPNHNVLWITDEDDIVSNVEQLTTLTSLLGLIATNSLSHNLGHLRCATAKSDDGSRSIEDALAYADLAAGSVTELMTAMQGNHRKLQKQIVSPSPQSVSWKARGIGQWLADSSGALKRHICVMDFNRNAPGGRVLMLRLHAYGMPSSVISRI